jgi:uncharacterized protein (UPF0276 family)
MKLAMNYSPQAAELVRKGQIELDYFKTPPWPNMIDEAALLRPIKVHFNLKAGNAAEPDWAEIDQFLATTETAYVNTHLMIGVNDMPHIPLHAAPNAAQHQEVFERLCASTQKLCDYFGAERVIAENVPYRENENTTLRACAEPEIITQVVETTGCGFLLDVSHARIAAHYLDIEPHEYIEALPVQKLRELHLTGIHDWDGYQMDHLPILAADWPWLDWVLEKVNAGVWGKADMLAFEYGGTGEFFRRFSDPVVMAAQVPRLYAACHAGKKTRR